jgi:stage III sporulation protein AG
MKFPDAWTHWLPKQEQRSARAEPQQSVLLSPNAGRILAGLVVFGALLLMFSRPPVSDKAVVSPTEGLSAVETSVSQSSQSTLEQELQTILSRIAQAGNVWVYISMETSTERVIAEEVTTQMTVETKDKNNQDTDKRESRRPVTVRDDALKAEQPIVLLQIEPKVRGVVIVADGAILPHVKYQLAQAAQTALGLPAHRVSVYSSR